MIRKNHVLGILIIVLVVLWGAWTLAPVAQPAPQLVQADVDVELAGATVAITEQGLAPDVVTLQAGQVVTWANQTAVLQRLVSGQPQRVWLPLVLRSAASERRGGSKLTYGAVGRAATADWRAEVSPGGIYTRTFMAAGTYNYYLAQRPAQVGQVIVQEPAHRVVEDVAGLIAAINAANADGASLDIIDLVAPSYVVTSAYTLENGFPVISSPIVINGLPTVSGTLVLTTAQLVRDGAAPSFRFFEVVASGDLTLNNVILQGGEAVPYWQGGTALGGAICSRGGTLTLSNTHLISNSAAQGGGLYVKEGAVQVFNSVVARNRAGGIGGGIHIRRATVALVGTQVSGNEANMAGGIENSGELSISGSAIFRNRSRLLGMYSPAIRNYDVGELMLVDSLLFANLGGGLYSEEPATIDGCCVLGNTPNSWGYVIHHNGISPLEASGNWWGAADGPSGAGPGSGDAVNDRVSFTPFLTAPLPGCPIDPFVTEVVINHSGVEDYNYVYLPLSKTLTLSATVYGANGFDPTVTWAIVEGEGEGALSADAGANVVFTATATPQVVIVRATHVEDPARYTDVYVDVSEFSVRDVIRSEATVLTGGHVPLAGRVEADGTGLDIGHMAWSVVSGRGRVERPLQDASPYAIFYAPSTPGTTVVRASALLEPSVYEDIILTINADGPHTCSEPPVLLSGEVCASVSTGGLQENAPHITGFCLNEGDPLIGETQTITVTAAVNDPSTEPIQSVTVSLITDSGTHGPYDLTQVSGTVPVGDWRGSWVIQDTHCDVYLIEIVVTNAVESRSVVVTFH